MELHYKDKIFNVQTDKLYCFFLQIFTYFEFDTTCTKKAGTAATKDWER